MRIFNPQSSPVEEKSLSVQSLSVQGTVRQLADSLSSAAQNATANDVVASKRLASLEEQLVKVLPGNNLTAYVAFRGLQADYAARISKPGEDFSKIQSDWVAKLTQFVQAYPKAEDTPDALLQLGMVSEFLGKEVEAKSWYNQIVKKDRKSTRLNSSH